MMKIGYKKKVELSFSEATEKIKKELGKEGFGVVSEIFVSEHMKIKLEVDFEDYLILGVCSPKYAYKVLSVDKEIGLLLPCNVVIYVDYVDDGKVFISTVLPTKLIIDNRDLYGIALEVENKLKRIIDKV